MAKTAFRFHSFQEGRTNSLLIPKDFRKEYLVTHLLPNQIPELI